MVLAARFPADCTVASSPNADPRSSDWGQRCDGRVLGGLHRADPDPGQHERHRQHCNGRGVHREQGVGEHERRYPARQHPHRPPGARAVGPGARPGPRLAWQPGCRRHTTPARSRSQRRCRGRASCWLARRISNVAAALPASNAAAAPSTRPQAAAQHRQYPDPQRHSLAPLGVGSVVDGVHDRGRRQRPGIADKPAGLRVLSLCGNAASRE